MRNAPRPGLRNQSGLRTFFRIAGPLLMAVALVLIGLALADFFAAFDDPSLDAQPTRFWMFFAALPFFLVGGGMIQAGYLGVAARYAAGETMPVVRDSAAYLTDGVGLLGVGRTVDDAQSAAGAAAVTGPCCRSCGVRNDADARFCDGCGRPVA